MFYFSSLVTQVTSDLIRVNIYLAPSITDLVVEKIAKRMPEISVEQRDRLNEKVTKLKTALEDERSGNSKVWRSGGQVNKIPKTP